MATSVARKGFLYMKRLFLVLGTAVVVLSWLSGARAQAEAIQWTASESLIGPSVLPNGALFINSQNVGEQAHVALIPGSTTSGANSGSVVLANLSAFDQSNSKASFGGPSAGYSLSLTLRDSASGASGSLIFGGNLSGIVDPQQGPAPADITNTFLGPTTQSLKLGQNLYNVTIGPFVPPDNSAGPTGSEAGDGSISASIAVQPAANATPEPSTLMLACLGLPSLGLARCFRRRKDIDRNASNA